MDFRSENGGACDAKIARCRYVDSARQLRLRLCPAAAFSLVRCVATPGAQCRPKRPALPPFLLTSMIATSGSTRRQQLVIFVLLFITLNSIGTSIPGAYAHLEDKVRDGSADVQSHVLTNWFRHVSSTSSDGSWLWGWAWGADNTVSVVDRSPPVSFVSRPASFGRVIEDALNGYGIPMNSFTVQCHDDKNKTRNLFGYRHGDLFEGIGPNLGCPRLCPSGNHMPLPEESWIAIVQRGNCSFVSKVRCLDHLFMFWR